MANCIGDAVTHVQAYKSYLGRVAVAVAELVEIQLAAMAEACSIFALCYRLY